MSAFAKLLALLDLAITVEKLLAAKLLVVLNLAITVEKLLPQPEDVSPLLGGGEKDYSESLRVQRDSNPADEDSDDDDVPAGGRAAVPPVRASAAPLREGTSGAGDDTYTVSINASGMVFTV